MQTIGRRSSGSAEYRGGGDPTPLPNNPTTVSTTSTTTTGTTFQQTESGPPTEKCLYQLPDKNSDDSAGKGPLGGHTLNNGTQSDNDNQPNNSEKPTVVSTTRTTTTGTTFQQTESGPPTEKCPYQLPDKNPGVDIGRLVKEAYKTDSTPKTNDEKKASKPSHSLANPKPFDVKYYSPFPQDSLTGQFDLVASAACMDPCWGMVSELIGNPFDGLVDTLTHVFNRTKLFICECWYSLWYGKEHWEKIQDSFQYDQFHSTLTSVSNDYKVRQDRPVQCLAEDEEVKKLQKEVADAAKAENQRKAELKERLDELYKDFGLWQEEKSNGKSKKHNEPTKQSLDRVELRGKLDAVVQTETIKKIKQILDSKKVDESRSEGGLVSKKQFSRKPSSQLLQDGFTFGKSTKQLSSNQLSLEEWKEVRALLKEQRDKRVEPLRVEPKKQNGDDPSSKAYQLATLEGMPDTPSGRLLKKYLDSCEENTLSSYQQVIVARLFNKADAEIVARAVGGLRDMLTKMPQVKSDVDKKTSDLLLNRDELCRIVQKMPKTRFTKVLLGFLEKGSGVISLNEWTIIAKLAEMVLIENKREFNDQRRCVDGPLKHLVKVCEKTEKCHTRYTETYAYHYKKVYGDEPENEDRRSYIEGLYKVKKERDKLDKKERILNEEASTVSEKTEPLRYLQARIKDAENLQFISNFAWKKLSRNGAVDHLEKEYEAKLDRGHSHSRTLKFSVGIELGYTGFDGLVDLPPDLRISFGFNLAASIGETYVMDDENYYGRLYDLINISGTFSATVKYLIGTFVGSGTYSSSVHGKYAEWANRREFAIHQFEQKSGADANCPEYNGHSFIDLIDRHRHDPEFSPYLSIKNRMGLSSNSYMDAATRDGVKGLDADKKKLDATERKSEGDIQARFSVLTTAVSHDDFRGQQVFEEGERLLKEKNWLDENGKERVTAGYKVTKIKTIKNLALLRSELLESGADPSVMQSVEALAKAQIGSIFRNAFDAEIEQIKSARDQKMAEIKNKYSQGTNDTDSQRRYTDELGAQKKTTSKTWAKVKARISAKTSPNKNSSTSGGKNEKESKAIRSEASWEKSSEISLEKNLKTSDEINLDDLGEKAQLNEHLNQKIDDGEQEPVEGENRPKKNVNVIPPVGNRITTEENLAAFDLALNKLARKIEESGRDRVEMWLMEKVCEISEKEAGRVFSEVERQELREELADDVHARLTKLERKLLDDELVLAGRKMLGEQEGRELGVKRRAEEYVCMDTAAHQIALKEKELLLAELKTDLAIKLAALKSTHAERKKNELIGELKKDQVVDRERTSPIALLESPPLNRDQLSDEDEIKAEKIIREYELKISFIEKRFAINELKRRRDMDLADIEYTCATEIAREKSTCANKKFSIKKAIADRNLVGGLIAKQEQLHGANIEKHVSNKVADSRRVEKEFRQSELKIEKSFKLEKLIGKSRSQLVPSFSAASSRRVPDIPSVMIESEAIVNMHDHPVKKEKVTKQDVEKSAKQKTETINFLIEKSPELNGLNTHGSSSTVKSSRRVSDREEKEIQLSTNDAEKIPGTKELKRLHLEKMLNLRSTYQEQHIKVESIDVVLLSRDLHISQLEQARKVAIKEERLRAQPILDKLISSRDDLIKKLWEDANNAIDNLPTEPGQRIKIGKILKDRDGDIDREENEYNEKIEIIKAESNDLLSAWDVEIEVVEKWYDNKLKELKSKSSKGRGLVDEKEVVNFGEKEKINFYDAKITRVGRELEYGAYRHNEDRLRGEYALKNARLLASFKIDEKKRKCDIAIRNVERKRDTELTEDVVYDQVTELLKTCAREVSAIKQEFMVQAQAHEKNKIGLALKKLDEQHEKELRSLENQRKLEEQKLEKDLEQRIIDDQTRKKVWSDELKQMYLDGQIETLAGMYASKRERLNRAYEARAEQVKKNVQASGANYSVDQVQLDPPIDEDPLDEQPFQWVPKDKSKPPIHFTEKDSSVERNGALLAKLSVDKTSGTLQGMAGLPFANVSASLTGSKENLTIALPERYSSIAQDMTDRTKSPEHITMIKKAVEKQFILINESIINGWKYDLAVTNAQKAKAEEVAQKFIDKEEEIPNLKQAVLNRNKTETIDIVEKRVNRDGSIEEVTVKGVTVQNDHFTTEVCLKYLEEDHAKFTALQHQKAQGLKGAQEGIDKMLKNYNATSTSELLFKMGYFSLQLLSLAKHGLEHKVLLFDPIHTGSSSDELGQGVERDGRVDDHKPLMVHIDEEQHFVNKNQPKEVTQLEERIRDYFEKKILLDPTFEIDENGWWEKLQMRKSVDFQVHDWRVLLTVKVDGPFLGVKTGGSVTLGVLDRRREHTNPSRDVDFREVTVSASVFGATNAAEMIIPGINAQLKDQWADALDFKDAQKALFLADFKEEALLSWGVSSSKDITVTMRMHHLREFDRIYQKLGLPLPGGKGDGWVQTYTRVLDTSSVTTGPNLTLPIDVGISPSIGLTYAESKSRCLAEYMNGKSFNNFIMHYMHERAVGRIDKDGGAINADSYWKTEIAAHQREGLNELFTQTGYEQRYGKLGKFTPLSNELAVRLEEFKENKRLLAADPMFVRKFERTIRHYKEATKHYEALKNGPEHLERLNKAFQTCETSEKENITAAIQQLENGFAAANKFFYEKKVISGTVKLKDREDFNREKDLKGDVTPAMAEKAAFDYCLGSLQEMFHAYAPHFNDMRNHSPRYSGVQMYDGQSWVAAEKYLSHVKVKSWRTSSSLLNSNAATMVEQHSSVLGSNNKKDDSGRDNDVAQTNIQKQKNKPVDRTVFNVPLDGILKFKLANLTKSAPENDNKGTSQTGSSLSATKSADFSMASNKSSPSYLSPSTTPRNDNRGTSQTGSSLSATKSADFSMASNKSSPSHLSPNTTPRSRASSMGEGKKEVKREVKNRDSSDSDSVDEQDTSSNSNYGSQSTEDDFDDSVSSSEGETSTEI